METLRTSTYTTHECFGSCGPGDSLWALGTGETGGSRNFQKCSEERTFSECWRGFLLLGVGQGEGVYRTQARLGTCNRAAQEMLSTSHTCYF